VAVAVAGVIPLPVAARPLCDTLAASGPHGDENWRFKMSASWLRILGLTIAASWLAVGCDSSPTMDVGGSCTLTSDCKEFLTCTMGKCHQACQLPEDCPAGENCVNTISNMSKVSICQLPTEADCTGTVCTAGLLCAFDLRCRNGGVSFTDCPFGQLCAGGFCANSSEVDANGQLPQKNPSLIHDAGVDLPRADAGGRDSGADLPLGLPDARSGADLAGRETKPDMAADLAGSKLPDAGADLAAQADTSADLVARELPDADADLVAEADAVADLVASGLPDAYADLVAEVDASADLADDTPASTRF